MKKPVILVILSLIAFGLASYISWSTFTEKQLAGCGEEGSGCNEVIKTKWGSWMGIPVSYAGVAIYGALLIVSILSLKKSTSTTWTALVFLTVLAATSGLWFMLLQLFVIRDICYFCTAIHTCGIIMAILVLRSIPISDGRNKKELKTREDWVRKSKWVRTIFIAMIGTGILIGGQFVRSENRMAAPVETPTPTEAPQQTAQPQTPAPAPTPQPAGRRISLLNGSIQLNLGDYPIIGSPEAKQIYAVFLDYTCPACRQLHPFLSDFIKKNPDKVAVIVLPLPLDADCNPKVPQTAYQHRGACNFWRLALSMWNISPDAFHQWDEYMFQFEFPPTPQEARSQADQLVGSSTIDAVLDSDSRVPDLLRQGIQLFESPAIARKSLPTLITDKEAFTGVGPSQSFLLSLP